MDDTMVQVVGVTVRHSAHQQQRDLLPPTGTGWRWTAESADQCHGQCHCLCWKSGISNSYMFWFLLLFFFKVKATHNLRNLATWKKSLPRMYTKIDLSLFALGVCNFDTILCMHTKDPDSVTVRAKRAYSIHSKVLQCHTEMFVDAIKSLKLAFQKVLPCCKMMFNS